VQPQSCREMRVKMRNHQNINTTNPTRKEIRFPFHYHVTFRVCPTAKSSHRAKIVSRGYVLQLYVWDMCVCTRLYTQSRIRSTPCQSRRPCMLCALARTVHSMHGGFSRNQYS
jgi:hypothetical protein